MTSLIGLLTVLHVWVATVQLALWTHPVGLRMFGMSRGQAETSRVLAANQGLYNGFIAIGLAASLLIEAPAGHTLKLLFLAFVATAGIFGGLTAKRSILVVQGLPALVALALLLR
ncbi:MAG: DUF1304 domain-containing protein [Myxococcota bacterium]